jgi:hypothetical protein
MAVARVQSEPLSGPIPVNRELYREIYGFRALFAAAKSSIALDMRGLWQRCPILGPLEQGIIDWLSGNDHSLIGTIGPVFRSSKLTICSSPGSR